MTVATLYDVFVIHKALRRADEPSPADVSEASRLLAGDQQGNQAYGSGEALPDGPDKHQLEQEPQQIGMKQTV